MSYKKREKRVYFGAVEGLQEEKYFRHVQDLINSDDSRKYDVVFRFKNAKGGDPLAVCKDASRHASSISLENKFKKCAFFDFDFKTRPFMDALVYCKKEKIFSGYTNVNFDLWLILHRTLYNKAISDTSGYVSELKKAFKLSASCDIKDEKVIGVICSKISLNDVRNAIVNAKRLQFDREKNNDVIPGYNDEFSQPYSKIYLFLDYVLDEVF